MVQIDNNRNIFFFLKGLSCLCVVIGHSISKLPLAFLVGPALRFALPVFLMISGYYAVGANNNKLKKRIFKLCKLLLCCTIFYTITTALLDRVSISDLIIQCFSPKQLLKTILLSEFPIWRPGWYIIGLIESYITLMIFNKFNRTNILIKIAPALIVIGTTLRVFSETYLSGIMNCFFVAIPLPWFLLGMKWKDKIDHGDFKSSNFSLILLIVVGYIIAITPYLFDTKINFRYFGVSLLSISFIALVIKNKHFFRNKILINIGRQYSTMIYVYHGFIIEVIIRVMIHYSIFLNGLFFATSTVLVTLFISIVLTKIKSKFKKVLI